MNPFLVHNLLGVFLFIESMYYMYLGYNGQTPLHSVLCREGIAREILERNVKNRWKRAFCIGAAIFLLEAAELLWMHLL